MKIASRKHDAGFTVVELIIVIAVIAILAALVVVGYNGLQQSARDKALLSDVEAVAAEVTRAGVNNNGVYDSSLSWNSASGGNSSIRFSPTTGNTVVVKVSIDGSEYCISAYNPKSSSKTLATATRKGSSATACTPQWTGFTDGAAGGTSTCGVTLYGTAFCWGNNQYGNVGNNTTTVASVPTPVHTGGVLANKVLKSVSVGQQHSCAVDIAGAMYCWGLNTDGQLGNNSTTNSSVPVAVNMSGALSGKTIKVAASGFNQNCVIASDDRAYCWGNNLNGQLGDNSTVASPVPVAVNTSGVLSGKTLIDIAVGTGAACAIASDGAAYCWGLNANGQLGNNSITNSSVPVAVVTSGALSGKSLIDIKVGGNQTCGLTADGYVYCWGNNSLGQLGNGTTTQSRVPVAVDTGGVLSGKTVKALTVTAGSGCAIASDERAYCWGSNSNGVLGNNSSTNSLSPTPVDTSGVLSGKSLKAIMLANSSGCTVGTDNKFYCWGYNGWGQFGNNTFTSSLVPVATNDPSDL